MVMRWAFLFPGQGAQYVGMGKEFYDQFLIAKEVFQEADECLGRSFSNEIFFGSPEELTLTKNSQIAIYITSIAILRAVQGEFPSFVPQMCTGLSLGEYTALTAAGKISFSDCLRLVQVRAEAMDRACKEIKGAMDVVLGLSEEVIESVIKEAGISSSVWIANLNCPGQVVIAGTVEGVAFARERLKAYGAKRVLPLDVSGAFHSGLMESARIELAQKMKEVSWKESPIAVVMNVSGEFLSSADQIPRLLIEQVTSPVRWEKGIRTIMETQVDGYLEMGPGKTLSAMNKRIGVAVPTYSIESIEDLKKIPTVHL